MKPPTFTQLFMGIYLTRVLGPTNGCDMKITPKELNKSGPSWLGSWFLQFSYVYDTTDGNYINAHRLWSTHYTIIGLSYAQAPIELPRHAVTIILTKAYYVSVCGILLVSQAEINDDFLSGTSRETPKFDLFGATNQLVLSSAPFSVPPCPNLIFLRLVKHARLIRKLRLLSRIPHGTTR